MTGKRSRLVLFGVLALALSVTVGLTVGSAEAKKKKKKKAPATKVFTEIKAVNLAIPNAIPNPPGGVSTPVAVQFNVGSKAFKNRVVGDVNLTFQTTGSGAGAANDLSTYLIAPNGRAGLPAESLGGAELVSIGPLTIDDDTPTELCDQVVPPACANPLATLNRPFAGRANTVDDDDDLRPLSIFDGVPMRGTWTFGIFDEDLFGTNTLTSILNQVGLEVTAARPVAP